MLNCAAIMGRLTAEPEIHTTGTGVPVCSFTVAVDRSFVKQGEERQADFIDVVAWRNTAEFVCKYFRKGSMIAVNGSMQTRNYEDKNGNKRKSTELIAAEVNFCGGPEKQEKADSVPNNPVPDIPVDDIPEDDIPEDDLPF